jgi:hypothetical protein
MDRIYNILNGIEERISAQKTYDGKKRNELENSDFLFPETKSFPIVTPSDVKDAISNFGRMKGGMSYDTFLHKLYNMCKRKGPAFVAALPQASKDKLNIKSKSDLTDIVDIDTINDDDESNDDSMLEIEDYKAEYLEMALVALKDVLNKVSSILNNTDLDRVKENLTEPWLQSKITLIRDYVSTVHDFVKFYDPEDDSEETEAARKEIDHHRKHHHKTKQTVHISHIGVLPGLITHINPKHDEHNEQETHEEPNENNEPINESDDAPSDSPSGPVAPSTPASDKPGLWENIRKKKEREGKNYRPAKPGDKDRPDPNQWKKLTK